MSADNSDPYGSFQGGPLAGGYGAQGGNITANKVKSPFIMAQRRRLNILAIGLALFVPWLIFVFAAWSLSFKVRYDYPMIAYSVLLVCFMGVVIFAYLALKATREKMTQGLHIPSWYIFCFLTSLFMLLAGILIGNYIYSTYCQPSYQVAELTTYHDVDASKLRGAQMMDAGTIAFTSGTKLDLTKAMMFHDRSSYCVAPLIVGDLPPQSYDFWVVGKGCCSLPVGGYPNGYNYHCGSWNNLEGAFVNRLMNDEDRPYYRMAVQQAEGAFKINAVHPLFFVWPHSSSSSSSLRNGTATAATSNDYGSNQGSVYFQAAVFGMFIVQLFLVVVATMAFSTLGNS